LTYAIEKIWTRDAAPCPRDSAFATAIMTLKLRPRSNYDCAGKNFLPRPALCRRVAA
jgi:hypothetical protein